ncbi:hypothetical protein NVP1238A_61 [Vibrio phage 1.238.A._10N.261.52.F10]|uniref:Uncharacterized protein n=1 Tax=Vibrio phage 1.238.A._10N.261.52.F10 TaxID=1881231 RepID=A0A2I7RUH8_9CAUD|nr:hypothetical protein KNT79_gp61 [Vibrio phage 1.238.A._10N.261.52.F10]AUR97310.1 hypothetical protein NVP1238A_61 [Vibrio phage 1.238.A._10N.261.52.F10]AUR97404.1 hypothetical protein NVP1238B_62 [Vibrio phage 1.238.B._10N.261.52.F10]
MFLLGTSEEKKTLIPITVQGSCQNSLGYDEVGKPLMRTSSNRSPLVGY